MIITLDTILFDQTTKEMVLILYLSQLKYKKVDDYL